MKIFNVSASEEESVTSFRITDPVFKRASGKPMYIKDSKNQELNQMHDDKKEEQSNAKVKYQKAKKEKNRGNE